MFDPTDHPRVFGVPPGADFPRALIAGIEARMPRAAPEDLARVEIFVNTRRMQRRLKALCDDGPARLLPRIRLVTDLARDTRFADVPPPASALRRRLELTQLVGKLLDQQPDLAPRSALFDLADSLAGLMDEMQGEGVTPDAIRTLDVSDQSGHWQRSLEFVALVERYFGAESELDPDAESRQRMVIERLTDGWQSTPPDHPVLVAGSTGSRGTTAMLMRAVSRLPQGAVVLPGVDFDTPAHVWQALLGKTLAEDHPQFRFAQLADDLAMSPTEFGHWNAETDPPNPARNRLVSLALRPAPVTDQWLTEGQRLQQLDVATDAMTLIEAPSARAEASAIALALRGAVEDGKIAALITPDRTLTRQVAAGLDRWGIVPDDSAGRPLPLSAPGRFLRHVSALFGQKLTAEALLTLLKHPLTNTGSNDRGAHLLNTRELELSLRRFGPRFPGKRDLIDWAAKRDPDVQEWAVWLGNMFDRIDAVAERCLASHLAHHTRVAEALAAGPSSDGSGALWEEAAGREAKRWVDELQREAAYGGTLSAADYVSLFQAVLSRGEVREAVVAHPGVMIWGTLEARVQGADLVILAGLNEGIWPEQPSPDPWLNRSLRAKSGLLLPERQIGLSAHDFQQAVAAKEVILTRSVRDAEAQTVPSRWVNRLVNFLGGVSEEGAGALKAMRARGARWLQLAERIDTPTATVRPAPRPSPMPPVDARPKEISITEVQTLIRDPYAVYARRILRLNPLDPLVHTADAPMRGIILHEIVERFIEAGAVAELDEGITRLMEIADTVLDAQAAWPAARRLWRARIARVAEWFVSGEMLRQADRTPVALERKGRLFMPQPGVTLRGKVDRVDRRDDGGLVIYDYKTGAPPTANQQKHFDKQLMLAALMAEQGALEGVAASRVTEVAYIGLGGSPKFDPVSPQPGDIQQVRDEFTKLIAAYQTRDRGYTARRAVVQRRVEKDYDHLARFGEWDESDSPIAQEVG